MDLRDLHRMALDAFSRCVDHLPADALSRPTPCTDWDVRALLNHVVGENRWIPPLLAGKTVAEVGDDLDGDLLGDDPVAAWHDSTGPALDAVARTPLDRTVHLSFGDVPAADYLWQLTTDVLVHTWDLARATGQDETLPAEVVDACARWFDGVEDAYRSAGAIGPAVPTDGADPAVALLGRFGRDPRSIGRLTMGDRPMYHDGSRQLQDHFDSRRLADRLEQVTVHPALTPHDAAFVRRSSMFFLATADADGWPDCSYKGGMPGFVKVLDPTAIAVPSYDGNGMFRSLGNLLVNPRVGILFIDFERPDRMRVQGTATIHDDEELCAAFDGAQAVVRVAIERVFPNCPRYIHHMELVEHSAYSPRPDHEPPVPDWKRMEVFRDVLPGSPP